MRGHESHKFVSPDRMFDGSIHPKHLTGDCKTSVSVCALLSKADFQERQGNAMTAAVLYDQAIGKASSAIKSAVRATLMSKGMVLKSAFLERQGKTLEAADQLDAAFMTHAFVTDKRIKASIISSTTLAKAGFMERHGHVSEVNALYDRALKASKSSQDRDAESTLQATALIAHADFCTRQGRESDATVLYELALKAHAVAISPAVKAIVRASAMMAHSEALEVQGDLTTAISIYEQVAISASAIEGEPYTQIRSNALLANAELRERMRNFVEAERLFEGAIEAGNASSNFDANRDVQVKATLAKAGFMERRKRISEATKLYLQATELAELHSDRFVSEALKSLIVSAQAKFISGITDSASSSCAKRNEWCFESRLKLALFADTAPTFGSQANGA